MICIYLLDNFILENFYEYFVVQMNDIYFFIVVVELMCLLVDEYYYEW